MFLSCESREKNGTPINTSAGLLSLKINQMVAYKDVCHKRQQICILTKIMRVSIFQGDETQAKILNKV